MYSLVQFVEDHILYITPSKGITLIEGKLVWAPYKCMGYYEANIIATNSNKSALIEMMREKKREQGMKSKKGYSQQQICERNLREDEFNNVQETSFGKKGSSKDNSKTKSVTESILSPEAVNNGMKSKKGYSEQQICERNLREDEFNNVEETSFAKKGSSKDNSKTKSVTESILSPEAVSNGMKSKKGYYSQQQICERNLREDEFNDVQETSFGKKGSSKDNSKTKSVTESILSPEAVSNGLKSKKGNSQQQICERNIRVDEFNNVEETSFGKKGSPKDNLKTRSVTESILSPEAVSNVNGSPNQCKEKNSHKRHCCLFCMKTVFQIVRHWSNVHSQENEVKEIMALHISNPLRRNKIDKLRRKGDFQFNKSHPSNYIVTRISKSGTVFVPCPTCFGYFSKKNLRHHKKNCSPNKGSRHLQGNSRKLLLHIHEKASETLKNVITPDMFHDKVTNQIFFDEILVIYGNYLCIKYTEHHLKNHIRAQLRLLGRFMVSVKVHDNSIRNCKELIHSRNIETIRKAIDDVAEIDPSSNIYKHPTNARALLTELKKVIQVVKSESDKTEDDNLMKRAKGLSRRVKQELAPYINRVCKNSENKHRRSTQQKYNELPENEEIGTYLEDLYGNIASSRDKLKIKFSLSVWTTLTQNVLVYLAVFNRKRPGETQRIEVADFDNRECVTNRDLIHLDESDRVQADKYERIGFNGKLCNSTALLVDKTKVLPGIKLILKYRKAAGVHPSNPYLFAKPSTTENKITFDAYRCHRQFCETMGINHKNLTFTKLRKHFATEVAKKVTSQEEERRVSSYMSHDFNIHKKIYDQSTVLTDITKVSKHLEGTMKERKDEMKKNKSRIKRKNISETSSSENDGTTGKESQRSMHFKGQGTQIRNKRTLKKRRLEDKDYNYNLNNNSTSEDDEPSLEEVEHCIGKFRKRRLWTSLEKQTTRSFFEAEIFGNKAIEKEKVQRFKEIYKEIMMHRPVSMIRQWVEREMLKTEERRRGIEDKRPRYSTPEKELLESSMERHSLEGSEPSLRELEELISKHDIFKRRTAESLFRKFIEMQQKKSTSFNNTSD